MAPSRARLADPDPSARLRVFVDADVIVAGAASPSEHGGSLVVLRLAEMTLIEAFASVQVVLEAERNVARKLPAAYPALRLLLDRCLKQVPDPSPGSVEKLAGLADPKDLPILVAALEQDCPYLVTHNARHYRPGHPDVSVLSPGDFVKRLREHATTLRINNG